MFMFAILGHFIKIETDISHVLQISEKQSVYSERI
jgi:hypothetical protein